jgi:hypothetical protein
MRTTARLALLPLLLLTTAVIAAPLEITDQGGSPAVEGDGSSSTTVSLAGGTVGVTLEGEGTLNVYSNSGTVEAEGSGGVPELGIELGGGLGVAPDADGAPAGSGASAGTPDPDGSHSDGPGAGPAAPGAGPDIDPRRPGTTTTASAEGACSETVPQRSAGSLAIALVLDPRRVSIVTVCDATGRLSASAADAIEKNDVLIDVLARAGFAAGDVLQVESRGRGAAIVYVHARG